MLLYDVMKQSYCTLYPELCNIPFFTSLYINEVNIYIRTYSYSYSPVRTFRCSWCTCYCYSYFSTPIIYFSFRHLFQFI